jgi:hypothetical protein
VVVYAVETRRLRRLQQPSQVERLLEAYVTRGNFLPEGAYRVRDPEALPAKLRRILIRATGQGEVWTCWTYGVRFWLFTGNMSLPLSRERGTPVLRVSLYDDEGELKEAGTWMAAPGGKWQRCAD